MDHIHSEKKRLHKFEMAHCIGGTSVSGGFSNPLYKVAYGFGYAAGFCTRAYDKFYPLVLK